MAKCGHCGTPNLTPLDKNDSRRINDGQMLPAHGCSGPPRAQTRRLDRQKKS